MKFSIETQFEIIPLTEIANQDNRVPNMECDNSLTVSAKQERLRDSLTTGMYVNSESVFAEYRW